MFFIGLAPLDIDRRIFQSRLCAGARVYADNSARWSENLWLSLPEDADKTITELLNPANVRGTKLLTHVHIARDDDQWIFFLVSLVWLARNH